MFLFFPFIINTESYPNAQKATRHLAWIKFMFSVSMLFIWGIVFYALGFFILSSFGDDIAIPCSLILAVLISILLRLKIYPLLIRKNEEEARNESELVLRMNSYDRSEYEKSIIVKSRHRTGMFLIFGGLIFVAITIGYFISSTHAIAAADTYEDDFKADRTYYISDFCIFDKFAYEDNGNYYLAMFKNATGTFSLGAIHYNIKNDFIDNIIESGETYDLNGYFSSYKSDVFLANMYYTMSVNDYKKLVGTSVSDTGLYFEYICSEDEKLLPNIISGAVIIVIIAAALLLTCGIVTYVKAASD